MAKSRKHAPSSLRAELEACQARVSELETEIQRLRERKPTTVITKPKLLLCEGQEDQMFLNGLLESARITDIQVADYGGVTKFPKFMQALVAPLPGFREVVSLGITRDANASPDKAFTSIRNMLKRLPLPVPTSVGEIVDGTPCVGVMLLPDGHNPGVLEDLCLASIADDKGLSCVDEFFGCVKKKTGREHSGNSMAKARIRAWLTTHDPPDLLLGQVAKKGWWNYNHPAMDRLKDFLHKL